MDDTDNTIVQTIESHTKLYLTGPFGAGKTPLALRRVQWLLQQERVRGDGIVVLVPQRTLATPFYTALRQGIPAGSPVRITTVAGLARAAVELYWPLLAEVAGFADPGLEPTFLNLETSQYHMAQLVESAVRTGDFDAIRLDRSRIISQVLDNLNKSALNGFSIEDAYHRLELAVPPGEQRTGRLNALAAARRISLAFRELCLRATLVDFSLQIELFNRHILTNSWSKTHLLRSHRHLVIDNIEEDTVTAHNLVAQWLPALDSALVVSDTQAGYRFFLGAAPSNVEQVAQLCDARIELPTSQVPAEPVQAMIRTVERLLDANPGDRDRSSQATPTVPATTATVVEAIHLPETTFRFYPQMLEWVVKEVRELVVESGVPPGEIAILAPFVSDALRFSLQTALAEHAIETTTHRPSRSLQSEPAARTLLTLAALAHPQWGIRPEASDVTQALLVSILRLDPIRASLLSHIVYPPQRGTIELARFGELGRGAQERITYTTGEQFDQLRDWLYAYRTEESITPLDQFFARLFGECLSQPGFGFHVDFDAARIANQLVESARNFRWAFQGVADSTSQPDPQFDAIGRDYLHLINSGALGALYIPGWREADNAVLIAPAYTFLMRNRPVSIQFWLDVGSTGWWERLYQPLTHPYVLSSDWPHNRVWMDMDEYQTRQDTLRRLIVGLCRRTKKRVYLGISDYDESGVEQRGALLSLLNRILAAPVG